VWGKSVQILQNLRAKHVGVQTLHAAILRTGGNGSRAYSYIVETKDPWNIGQALLSVVLNLIILVQICHYPGASNVARSEKNASTKTTSREAPSDGTSDSPKKIKKVKRD
jgi:hypothetical protein